jgi:hypothetical protein
MTTEERFERIERILESLAASVVARDNQTEAHGRQIDGLINLASKLTNSIVAHDQQIGVLLELAEKHEKAIANLEKQWQAYLNTLPRN